MGKVLNFIQIVYVTNKKDKNRLDTKNIQRRKLYLTQRNLHVLLEIQ